MRKLFIFSTLIFWLAIAGFWLDHLLQDQKTVSTEIQPITAPQSYSLAEVMRHRQTSDCWMAIAGVVYDITAYLPSHPSNPDIINAWCGNEATAAWQTKTRSRPHSSYADSLLQQYRIGILQAAP